MTIPQPIIDLDDRFPHGGMDRRSVLDRLAILAGGAPAAAPLAWQRAVAFLRRHLGGYRGLHTAGSRSGPFRASIFTHTHDSGRVRSALACTL